MCVGGVSNQRIREKKELRTKMNATNRILSIGTNQWFERKTTNQENE